jgi:hypothetical protein
MTTVNDAHATEFRCPTAQLTGGHEWRPTDLRSTSFTIAVYFKHYYHLSLMSPDLIRHARVGINNDHWRSLVFEFYLKKQTLPHC